MRILIVTPAPAGSRHGNRVTATRWARILRALGHSVWVETAYAGQDADLLIALHARKSHRSIARFRRDHPRNASSGKPVFVALTGTDLYSDLKKSKSAVRSLEMADRLIVLQALAAHGVPRRFRDKVRVIHQSCDLNPAMKARSRGFDVCVIGHLRPVKDPFRAAQAARLLPPDSQVCIVHFGAAMSPAMARRARREVKINPRYHWFADRPRYQVLRRLRRARVLVMSSRLEGGANAVSEAIALGIPVLATRVPGNVGLLGSRYPGYFRVGDTAGLARLLRRVETDPAYLARLAAGVAGRRRLTAPASERAAWKRLFRPRQQSQPGSSQ